MSEAFTNTVTTRVVKFVKLPGADKELELNPSAKVIREIELMIADGKATLNFSTVTKAAAVGTHRNGAINKVTVEMPLEQFLDADQIPEVLGQEPYLVVQKVIKMSTVLHHFFGEKELQALMVEISKI